MRAVRIHGKQDMRIENVPDLEVGAGQVLIRVAEVGICGSDLHYLSDGAAGVFRIKAPLIPGHEMSGVVEEDPSGRYAHGTPVTVHPATWGHRAADLGEDQRHLWPGGGYLGSASTWPHTHGAMADLLVVADHQVRPLPTGLPLRRAALAEPLAVGLHAISVGGGVANKRVLVSGSGPIGLLTAAGALAQGAAEVTCTDLLPGPLERAAALGAQTVQVGREELPESAYDLTFECAGVPQSLHTLLVATKRAGILVQVGNVPDENRPVNLAPMVSKEIQLRGTFRFNTEIDDAVALLLEHPEFSQIITHVFSLGDVAQAFAVASNSAASGKVLVEVNPEAEVTQ
jgi:L-idonate 5-dehydrogenase